jgi:hypothetical protein
MSDPRGSFGAPSAVPLGTFLACAALWVGGAAAQDATTLPADEAELIERVEALMPEYQAAATARDASLRARRAADEARRPLTPLDTIQVGPMRVVSLPEEADVARDLFTDMWREQFPGVIESPSLRRHMFVFQWRTRLRPLSVVPGPGEILIDVDISRVWAPTRASAAVVVADAIARALADDFPADSPMKAWLTYRASPDGERAYRVLAGGESGATRGCLVGDTSACLAALGFGLREGADRLPSWFSDEERQAMVERAAEDGRVDRDGPPYRRCVEENDARACGPILAELDWVTNPPVSDRLRAHLLWYAGRVGGEGAWERAVEGAEVPVPEALARIADRPVERLVADWRADVVTMRPDVHAGLGARGTRVLLWSLIFAAFAMGSTRWRLA